jgi:hypothetical protein
LRLTTYSYLRVECLENVGARRLTTVWASTACCRDNFSFILPILLVIGRQHHMSCPPTVSTARRVEMNIVNYAAETALGEAALGP